MSIKRRSGSIGYPVNIVGRETLERTYVCDQYTPAVKYEGWAFKKLEDTSEACWLIKRTEVTSTVVLSFYASYQYDQVWDDRVSLFSDELLSSNNNNTLLIQNNYQTNIVTTGAWVELVGSVSQTKITRLEIFNSPDKALQLGIGAVSSEQAVCYILPGGNRQFIPITIESGERISIRAVFETVNKGILLINGYG